MSRRALTHAVAAFAALISLHAAPALASLPAHAEVRVGRCVDETDFQRLVESRYHVQFSRVVAADIDRDGDIDIIAVTGRRLTVWVNDGAGHLTSQRPATGPSIDARAPATTFRGGSERSDPTTNDGAPTTAVLVMRAHAPPAFTTGDAAGLGFFVRVSAQLRSSAPRAPPHSS